MAIRNSTIVIALFVWTLSCVGEDRGDDSGTSSDAEVFRPSSVDAQPPPVQGIQQPHKPTVEIPVEASSPEPKAFCGNGVVDTNEQCDGNNSLRGMSCEAMGYFSGGKVTCDPLTCTYDTSRCSLGPICGNGVLEGNEQCEVGTIDELKCSELDDDYGDGYVTCDRQTCQYDLSRCNTKSVCGNSILEGSEQCDGDELNDMTCVDLNYGFTEGTLRCDPDTCTFDVGDCEYSNTCGNGVIEPGEQCDSYNLAMMSCAFLGFYSGTLTCSSDCRYDTSGCVNITSGSACFRGGDPRVCVTPPPSSD